MKITSAAGLLFLLMFDRGTLSDGRNILLPELYLSLNSYFLPPSDIIIYVKISHIGRCQARCEPVSYGYDQKQIRKLFSSVYPS